MMKFYSERESNKGVAKHFIERQSLTNELQSKRTQGNQSFQSQTKLSLISSNKFYGLKIDEPYEFSGSWLQFKDRHHVHKLFVSGEKCSADSASAEKYVVTFGKLIQEHNLTGEKIFNANDTGLYWQCLLQTTLAAADEKNMQQDSRELKPK